jgi:hypothetical protein
MTTQSSSRSVAATEKSDDEEGSEKKRCKKGDGGADVLTVFEVIDPEDPTAGHRCKGCM